jgi:hypothetical protein
LPGLLLFIMVGEPFGQLSLPSRLVAFTLRSRTIPRTYRHHFLLAQADVVRPRAWDARPPASCGETEPPGRPLFRRPEPDVALIAEPFA